jgi:hypothetical protein
MSVAFLVTGVTAFLRLRRALARANADRNQSAAVLAVLPPLPAGGSVATLRQDALSAALLQLMRLRAKGLASPPWLAALFDDGAQSEIDLKPNAPDWAIAEAVAQARLTWAETVQAQGGEFSVAEAYYLHAVTGDGHVKRRWARVAMTLADSMFDVLAANPQVLGLEKKAENIVAALAGQMSVVIGDDDAINASSAENFGERAFRVFLRSTLTVALEHPEFVAEEEHLQALAQGILRPLHEEVEANPDRRWIALDRLGSLLRGPVALGVLQTVQEHQKAFLAGDLADDKLLGAVTRAVLAEFVSVEDEAFEVSRVFSRRGLLHVYRAALGVAQERPELFIDGEGGPTERARTFLSGVARVVRTAPYPYNAESGLAPQVAGVALDVAQAYVSRRLVEDTGASDWSKAGMDAAEHIVDAVFGGLRAGLTNPGSRTNPLSQVFNRGMAVEVLQVIALHVAQRPGMVTGPDGSTETRGVAAAFATMVAQDQSGLLRAQDWRGLLGKLLDLTAQNPGALIGIDPAESPSSYVSVRLVSRLLSHAASELAQPPGAGRPRLMGARLAEMIAVTLAAAANNVIGGLRDQAAQDAHFAAFEAFLKRLSDAAAGEDVTLRMSAADVQHVYQWFVALVLDRGPQAVITDDDIRTVIRGAQEEVAAFRPPVAPAGGPNLSQSPEDGEDADAPALDDRPEGGAASEHPAGPPASPDMEPPP